MIIPANNTSEKVRSKTVVKALISLIVLLHLGINMWHGEAHTILEVALPEIKTAFIMMVIIVAPVVGAVLTWTRFALAGCWLVGVSMLRIEN